MSTLLFLIAGKNSNDKNSVNAMLKQYLGASHIFFITPQNKDDAIRTLAKKLSFITNEASQSVIETALFQREQITSTSIGTGIAIPHAKIATLSQFFIVIGIFGSGIDWNSIDEAPVRVAFAIIGPDDAPKTYLQLLSSITNIVRLEASRRLLLQAKTAEDVLKVFSIK